jgi:HEAT repeat protein
LAHLIADPAKYLTAEAPELRRLAVSVCSVAPSTHIEALRSRALEDPDPPVRALAVEALGASGGDVLETLATAGSDEEAGVREAVATAYGELGDAAAVDWLIDRASDDDDRLVREAAVASLGAIGDERAVPILLELIGDGPPRVRRRAVVALTVFDDPAIEPAIRRAAADRNPGVREAAEMVVGRESQVSSRKSQESG